MANRAIPFKIKPAVQGQNVADAIDVEVNATGFDGVLTTNSNNVQAIAQALDDYAGASTSELLAAINTLPQLNPNFYYERLSASVGLGTIATTYAIPASGAAPTFDIVPQKNSVGAIHFDIPLEYIFEGQIQLESDAACDLQVTGELTQFIGQGAAEVTITDNINVSIDATEPRTIALNQFSFEHVFSETGDLTAAIVGTTFDYRFRLTFTAFDRTSLTTRVVANLSEVSMIAPAVSLKQARSIIGARGPAGQDGRSTQVAALASRETLYTIASQPTIANVTAFNAPLTFPTGVTSVGDFALIEIGFSRESAGDVSNILILASSLVAATQSVPYTHFTLNAGGSRTANAIQLYISGSNLVYIAGDNRGYLRSVVGISFGETTVPKTWQIQDTTITAGSADPSNSVTLPSSGVLENFAYRIGNSGFLFDRAVTEGSWLLATQDSPGTSNLDDWDTFTGNEFPTTSKAFHFDATIAETNQDIAGSTATTSTTFYSLPNGAAITEESNLGSALTASGVVTGGGVAGSIILGRNFVIKIPTGQITPDVANNTQVLHRLSADGQDVLQSIPIKGNFEEISSQLSDADSGFNYFIFGTFAGRGRINGQSTDIFAVYPTTTNRFFTLDGTDVDLGTTLANEPFGSFSQDAQNAVIQSRVTPIQRRKLAGITEGASTSPVMLFGTAPSNALFRWREALDEISTDINDYVSADTNVVNTIIPPSFGSAKTFHVAIADNYDLTQFRPQGGGGETAVTTALLPTRIPGQKMYSVTIPITSTDSWAPYGTISDITQYTFDTEYKIGSQNYSENSIARGFLTQGLQNAIFTGSGSSNESTAVQDFHRVLTRTVEAGSDWVAPINPTRITATVTRLFAAFWTESRKTNPSVNFFSDITGATIDDFSTGHVFFYTNPNDPANTLFPGSQSFLFRDNVRIQNTSGDTPITTSFRKIIGFDYSLQTPLSNTTNVDMLRFGTSQEAVVKLIGQGADGLVVRVGRGDGGARTRTINVFLQVDNNQWRISVGQNLIEAAEVVIPDNLTGSLTVRISFHRFNNDNDEGVQTQNYVITDVGADQAASTVIFTFGLNSLTLNVSYDHDNTDLEVARRIVFIDTASPLTNAAIHYQISADYQVTENWNAPTTYADETINAGSAFDDNGIYDPSRQTTEQLNAPNRVLMLFQKANENDTEADPEIGIKIIVDGEYEGDSSDNFITRTGRPASDFDFNNIFIGNGLVAISHIQLYDYTITSASDVPSEHDLLNMYNAANGWLGLFLEHGPAKTRYNINADLQIHSDVSEENVLIGGKLVEQVTILDKATVGTTAVTYPNSVNLANIDYASGSVQIGTDFHPFFVDLNVYTEVGTPPAFHLPGTSVTVTFNSTTIQISSGTSTVDMKGFNFK